MTENINEIKKSPSKVMGILSIILAILSLVIGFFKAPEFVLAGYSDNNVGLIIFIEIYYVLVAVAYSIMAFVCLHKTDKKLISNKLVGASILTLGVAYTVCMLPIFIDENLPIYYTFTSFLQVHGLFLLPITIAFAVFFLTNKDKAGKTGLNITYFVFNIIYLFFYIIDCLDLMEEQNTMPSGFTSLLFVGVLIAFTIIFFIKIRNEIPKKERKPQAPAKPAFNAPHPQAYLQSQPRVARFDPYTGKPLSNEPSVTINANGERVITPAFSSSPANLYKNEKQEIENVKIVGEKILKLKELYDSGAITEQDYYLKKSELMEKL